MPTERFTLLPDYSTPETTVVAERVLEFINRNSLGMDRLPINEIYDLKLRSGAFVLLPEGTDQCQESMMALKQLTAEIEQALRNRHEVPNYEDEAPRD